MIYILMQIRDSYDGIDIPILANHDRAVVEKRMLDLLNEEKLAVEITDALWEDVLDLGSDNPKPRREYWDNFDPEYNRALEEYYERRDVLKDELFRDYASKHGLTFDYVKRVYPTCCTNEYSIVEVPSE
jgi:hypothetical protein